MFRVMRLFLPVSGIHRARWQDLGTLPRTVFLVDPSVPGAGLGQAEGWMRAVIGEMDGQRVCSGAASSLLRFYCCYLWLSWGISHQEDSSL